MQLTTKLGPIVLENPIMPGSGPLTGDDSKMVAIGSMGVGAIVNKTIAPQGAKVLRPCIYGGKDYILNNELWSEYPATKWVEDFLPNTVASLSTPIIMNVGYTPGDLEEMIPKLDAYATGYEINPRYSGKDFDAVALMVKTARSLTDKPLWVKMQPSVHDPVGFAKVCLENGAVGVTVASSHGPDMKIDLKHRRPVIGTEDGYVWTSGPTIKPMILGLIHQIKSEIPEISIIGSGGVSSAEDVLEYLIAGADAVQMLSIAMLKGRTMYEKVIKDLPVALERYNFSSIEEVKATPLDKSGPSYEPSYPVINHDQCVGCKLCEANCPYFALAYEASKIIVKKDKCFGCGLCEARCPKQAIKGVVWKKGD